MTAPAKDWRRAAELLARGGTARDPAPAPLRPRQGVVTAASNSDIEAGVCTITLGGDTETPIVGVACLESYTPAVNDVVWVLVNGTDLLVLGRVGWDPTRPFVEEQGSATVSVTSASSGTLSVNFTQPFTVAPLVQLTSNSTSFWVPFSSGISTSSFTITVRHIDATVTTASPIVHWRAEQKKPSSASG